MELSAFSPTFRRPSHKHPLCLIISILETDLTSTTIPSTMASTDAILAASARFPKPADRTFQYGTAGVSANPSDLPALGLFDISLVPHECVGIN